MTVQTCTRNAFRALNSAVLPAVKTGIGTPILPIGAGLVVLETVGRKSGKTRQVPLAATRLADQITVSTVRPDSLWIKNLEADPNGFVWIGGRKRAVTARVKRGRVTVATLTLV